MYQVKARSKLVPAYLILERESGLAEKPYQELARGRSGKAARQASPDIHLPGGEEIVKECDFLTLRIREPGVDCALTPDTKEAKRKEELEKQHEQDVAEADKQKRQEGAKADGSGMDCGCCFDTYALVSAEGYPLTLGRRSAV